MTVKNAFALSVISLVLIYVLILFFPAIKGDDNLTTFGIIKSLLNATPKNNIDGYVKILFLLPFAVLLGETVLLVLYQNDNTPANERNLKAVSWVLLGVFVFDFILKYFTGTLNNVSITPLFMIALLFAFVYFLHWKTKSKARHETSEEVKVAVPVENKAAAPAKDDPPLLTKILGVAIVLVLAGLWVKKTFFKSEASSGESAYTQKTNELKTEIKSGLLSWFSSLSQSTQLLLSVVLSLVISLAIVRTYRKWVVKSSAGD